MKRLFFALYVALFIGNSVYGQSRFHVDLDGAYYLGLHEHKSKHYIYQDEGHPYGFSYELTLRYDVSKRWSAGVGVALARDYNRNYKTIPFYATARYKALKQLPESYIFANVGLAPSTIANGYDSGFTSSLGIGYTKMFAKHFGLNFQIGYNLKTLDESNVYASPYGSADDTRVRHSLSFGVGVTF